MAGHAIGRGRVGRLVPASVRRLIDRLDESPIAVFDAMWTLLSWNRMWAALMGDPSALDEQDRNVVWRYFTHPSGKIDFTPAERENFEAATVADLRVTAARYPDDPRLRTLIERLCVASDNFRSRWEARAVAEHVHAVKTVRHPEVGALELDCDVLSTDSPAASKLALLATIGTEVVAL